LARIRLIQADLPPGTGHLDALDDADAVIRVDDLLADLELGDLSFPGRGAPASFNSRYNHLPAAATRAIAEAT
jgi:hypothetical protein